MPSARVNPTAGSHQPGARRKLLNWILPLATALGSLALAGAAQADTVVLSGGGVVVSTSDFFLSIGRPVVIHQPVIVSYPVYQFPHSTHYRIRTYPYHHYPHHRPYPRGVNRHLEPHNPPVFQQIYTPGSATFPVHQLPSSLVSNPRSGGISTSSQPVEIRSLYTPVVLPAGSIPADFITPATTVTPAGVTTERRLSPSPFNRSVMELQQ